MFLNISWWLCGFTFILEILSTNYKSLMNTNVSNISTHCRDSSTRVIGAGSTIWRSLKTYHCIKLQMLWFMVCVIVCRIIGFWICSLPLSGDVCSEWSAVCGFTLYRNPPHIATWDALRSDTSSQCWLWSCRTFGAAYIECENIEIPASIKGTPITRSTLSLSSVNSGVEFDIITNECLLIRHSS